MSHKPTKTNFDIKVEIKEELRKALILNIRARLPVGIVMSFYGYQHQVINLMQVFSHGTRAYIQNANGLPGFLVKFPGIVGFLENTDQLGKLEEITKY